MRKFFLPLLLALVAQAQTNLPTVPLAPPATTNSAIQTQLEAVIKAMPAYYNDKIDRVTDLETISLNDYDSLEQGTDDELKVDITAFIHAPAKLPRNIGIKLISYSTRWRFLEDHDLIFRFDEQKYTPKEGFYKNKIMDDASVVEILWPDVSVDQFRQMAWAEKVYFKLGNRNYEIPAYQRQKWKLLWKYFDLIKQKQDAETAAALGDAVPSKKP